MSYCIGLFIGWKEALNQLYDSSLPEAGKDMAVDKYLVLKFVFYMYLNYSMNGLTQWNLLLEKPVSYKNLEKAWGGKGWAQKGEVN